MKRIACWLPALVALAWCLGWAESASAIHPHTHPWYYDPPRYRAVDYPRAQVIPAPSRHFVYGFNVPTYNYGWFGAHYYPRRTWHRGYYDTHMQVSYRRGY
ncbi:MAG: hypothetical protein KF708_14380 [Pirellulales bacterium]|nr:hypothetical protein [Pirellulales bacterium]